MVVGLEVIALSPVVSQPPNTTVIIIFALLFKIEQQILGTIFCILKTRIFFPSLFA